LLCCPLLARLSLKNFKRWMLTHAEGYEDITRGPALETPGLALCSPSWNRFAGNSCWNRFAGNGLIDYVKTSVGLACAGSYGVRREIWV
jgi:hypothetical protein